MICNKDIMFIHVPKTGGMALSERLLQILPRPVYYSVPDGHSNTEDTSITYIGGKRHENLREARDIVERLGMGLDSFKKIIAAVRNPYDMEVSRYFYLRNGHPWDRGTAQNLALGGNFEEFACESLYMGRETSEIEDFFLLDGVMPDNITILRYENLQEDFEGVLPEIDINADGSLPIVNQTQHAHYREYLTSRAEATIYRRFRWLFDAGFYDRECNDLIEQQGVIQSDLTSTSTEPQPFIAGDLLAVESPPGLVVTGMTRIRSEGNQRWRLGLGQETVLAFNSTDTKEKHLHFRFRKLKSIPRQDISIRVNSKEMHFIQLNHQQKLATGIVEFKSIIGLNEVRLIYSDWNHKETAYAPQDPRRVAVNIVDLAIR